MNSRVRNHEGVWLDYGDPSAPHAHHADQSIKVSDSERIALIRAERALRYLELIVEHIEDDLSGCALRRIGCLFDCLREGLQIQRRRIGMAHTPT